MKLALLSDVHANLRALRACVQHARAAGADRFAFLGDLVGYGAEPAAVLDEVMALAAGGAIVLRGNHDEAALAPPTGRGTFEEATASWTHGQLQAQHRAFLAALPLHAELDALLLVHASAHEPGKWPYVDKPHAAAQCLEAAAARHGRRHVFCGHVHEQRVFYRAQGREPMPFEPVPGTAMRVPPSRSWVASIGSVGQPRDGDPRAMYALFDSSQACVFFHRVPYDHAAAADAVRRTGQPEQFARRLQEGR